MAFRLALLGCLSSLASAVEIDIRTLSLAPRSGAPFPVEVTVHGQPALVEGRLRVALVEGSRRLLDYRTGPLVISPGEHRFRLLLPPLRPSMAGGLAEWDLTLETADGTQARGGQGFTVPSWLQRVAVVAFVHPRDFEPPRAYPRLVAEGRLERSMGLEQGREERFQGQAAARPVVTWSARCDAADLPAEPVGFCAYDWVVLTPESMGAVSARQWEALRAWVRAGGSLLMLGDSNRPVAPGSPAGQALTWLRQNGQPHDEVSAQIQEVAGLRVEAWRADLGRVAFIHDLHDQVDLAHRGWNRLFSFLWKVRFSEEPEAWHTTVAAGSESLWSLAANHLLLTELMPDEVSVLSVSRLGWMMGLMLLVVGPLDYWVVRRLRRRWLTWILFPLSVGAMTALTFVKAEALMGEDVARGVTLVELGERGEAVRSHRVALRFVSRGREEREERTHQLSGPVARHQGHRHRVAASDWHYEGRLPSSYVTTRHLRQWDPEMEHALAIPGDVTVPEALARVDWEACRPSATRDAVLCQRELVRMLGDRVAWDGMAYVAGRTLATSVWGTRGRWVGALVKPGSQAMMSVPMRGRDRSWLRRDFVTDAMRSRYWVPYPSPESPRADRHLTDWVVVEQSQWVLTWKEGEERLVFRYRYVDHD